MFGNLFEEEEEDRFNSTSSGVRVTKGIDEPPPLRGRTNLCGIKNQGGTCYLNSLLQTLLFTPEFRGKGLVPIEIYQSKWQLLYFLITDDVILPCRTAIQFGARRVRMSERQGQAWGQGWFLYWKLLHQMWKPMFIYKSKTQNTEKHFPFISVGQSHPTGAAEIVCLLATGGPTECLHHWSHWQFWLEQQWGLSPLLTLKRNLFSAPPGVKFSFACYVIMWTGENTVLGLDTVCFHR